MGPCLPLTRVVAIVGGFALVGAFFMPWFASQGLLLSGQFLNDFLGSASTADLQRFVPGTTPTEAQLLRLLVDFFPACGALAIALYLILTAKPYVALKVALVLCGLVPLAAWAIGITRLPPGSTPQIGLSVIAFGSLGVLLGAGFEFVRRTDRVVHQDSRT